MADELIPGGAFLTLTGANRERFARIADAIAVALAMSLPWSTSATGILVGLWILAFIPMANKESLRRVLVTPAGGLPVLLWLLGLVGMLWADVTLSERLHGLNSFHKLLVIPLLMVHFQHSERAHEVMIGFLVSCGVLLAVSWMLFLIPGMPWINGKSPGIPVKDYIALSAIYIVCIVILIELASTVWQRLHRAAAAAYVLLAIAFLANIFFIATSRTALVIIPIILILFGIQRLGWKRTAGLLLALAVLAAVAWQFSTQLRLRVGTFWQEVEAYRSDGPSTSAAERLEFWKKSIGFIADAPVIGNGTGTISELFRKSAKDKTGVAALASENPHNQILAVAIQLGALGAIVLFAMWIAHLLLFRGGGTAAWIGLAIVVQNIIGSLFNSHLFDFTHGWLYVIGVGIAGGTVLKSRVGKPSEAVLITN